MYICPDSVENCNIFNQHNNSDDNADDNGVNWESRSENLNEALQRFNKKVETFPPLTDFKQGKPSFLCEMHFLITDCHFNGLMRLESS